MEARRAGLGPQPPAAAAAWLERHTGIPADAVRLARLAGATSSSVYAVEGWGEAGTPRFVLRVLDNADWLAQEPDLAEHEAAALVEAARAGVAAPERVAVADTDAGFDAPAVLMSFVPGRVELMPADTEAWLRALAITLVRIHAHPADGLAWSYRCWLDETSLTPPAWSRDQLRWQRGIDLWLASRPLLAQQPATFVHRDYHPTNVLFQAGRVRAVVDWINACRGPAGIDVAHCRVNLVLMAGPALADGFLRAYRRFAPEYEHHPAWDLEVLLDAALPSPSFYPPWAAFGMPTIARGTLRRRAQEYLGHVLARAAA